RAMTDMTADAGKQLEPADNDDAEIVVEPEAAERPPKKPRQEPVRVSEPEIQIEALAADAEEEAETEDDEADLRELRRRIAVRAQSRSDVGEAEPEVSEEARELEADEPDGDAALADDEVRAFGAARVLEPAEPVDEVRELEADEYAADVRALRARLAAR